MSIQNIKVFAHRGGRVWAPENTMAAFARSLESGVQGIELDVQRCASGELVVFHDHRLERTTNGVGLIADCSFDELRRLSAGAWFAPEFAEEKIPTLAEVLALVDGEAIINVEIKSLPMVYPGIEDDLIALLEAYRFPERIIVSSFENPLIAAMSSKFDRCSYATLLAGVPLDIVAHCRELGAEYWHPEFSCLVGSYVETAHSARIKVFPWTVNDEREWVEALKMGVDGIMTDDPAGLEILLKQVSEMLL